MGTDQSLRSVRYWNPQRLSHGIRNARLNAWRETNHRKIGWDYLLKRNFGNVYTTWVGAITDRVKEKVKKLVMQNMVGRETDILPIKTFRKRVAKPVLAAFVGKRCY